MARTFKLTEVMDPLHQTVSGRLQTTTRYPLIHCTLWSDT